MEQSSPDSSKLLDTRQYNPSDSYLVILIAMYIDVLAFTLMIVPVPPLQQFDDTPMMVSVLYQKKK